MIEGETLVEAAVCADRLAEIRRRRLDVAEAKLRLALDRIELGWSKQYAALLATLQVRPS